MGLFDRFKAEDDGEQTPQTPLEEAQEPAPRPSRSGSFAIADEVTLERILPLLDAMKLEYGVSPRGYVMVPFRNGMTRIQGPAKAPMLQVSGSWHSFFPLSALGDLQKVVTETNAQRMVPRCYTVTDDAGRVSVDADYVVPVEKGATDQQIIKIILHGIGSIQSFFEMLDGMFADPRYPQES